MRGSIIKRSENSYTIVLSLGKDPATGKKRQQWVSVKGNKKAAEKRLAELLHQLDTGTFVRPGKATVADYLNQWLQDSVYPNASPRTAEGYEYMVRKYIIPSLGQMALTELRPHHLQRLYSKITADGKSSRTGQYAHSTLHKSLEDAVKLGLIVRNPADAVQSPKVARRDMHIMDEKEIHLFLEMARTTPNYALFYTALFTAMRRSELLALRWSDVDLLGCQISVNHTMHVVRYGASKGQVIFKQPKTAKGRRLIPLPPSAAAVLREHREMQEKLRQELGMPMPNDELVFCQYDGKPLLPDTITHAWMRLARHCGLKGIRFHDARHSHASLLLKQGVHPKIVQERLGHSTIQITLDTYSHVAPGLQRAAANRFDDIVLPKEKEAAPDLAD